MFETRIPLNHRFVYMYIIYAHILNTDPAKTVLYLYVYTCLLNYFLAKVYEMFFS